MPPFWTNVAGRPRLQRLIITLLKLPQSSPRLREMILDLFHFINFSHTLHISTSCYSSLPRLPKKTKQSFRPFYLNPLRINFKRGLLLLCDNTYAPNCGLSLSPPWFTRHAHLTKGAIKLRRIRNLFSDGGVQEVGDCGERLYWRRTRRMSWAWLWPTSSLLLTPFRSSVTTLQQGSHLQGFFTLFDYKHRFVEKLMKLFFDILGV